MSFCFFFSGAFSNVIRYGKRMEILLFSVSFLRVQFSRVLSRGEEKKYNFLFSYQF